VAAAGWGPGGLRGQTAPDAGAGERRVATVGGRMDARPSHAAGYRRQKLVRLAAKRHAAAYLEQTDDVSERRACRVLALHRTPKRRQSGQRDSAALSKRIPSTARQKKVTL